MTFFSVILPEALTIVREFYEAFVIIAFVQLWVIYLGGPEELANAFSISMQEPQHVWITLTYKLKAKYPSLKTPECFHCIPMPFTPGLNFVTGVLTGIVQFSLVTWFACALMVMIVVTTVAMVLSGKWDEAHGVLVMGRLLKIPATLKVLSIGLAMYNMALVYFEIERNKQLQRTFKNLDPENKFLCVKAIIGLTAFQKFIVETVLPYFNVFEELVKESKVSGAAWTEPQIANGIQSFLLCCEILLLALWHLCAYRPDEFDQTDGGKFDSQEVGTVAMLSGIRKQREEAKVQRNIFHQLEKVAYPTDDLLNEAYEAFKVTGSDGSGAEQVSANQVKFMLKTIGIEEERIARILQHVDRDQDGFVTLMEFKQGMLEARDLLGRSGSSGSSRPPQPQLREPLL